LDLIAGFSGLFAAFSPIRILAALFGALVSGTLAASLAPLRTTRRSATLGSGSGSERDDRYR
jgi:hypothetical protein